jgi:hypothetical protein
MNLSKIRVLLIAGSVVALAGCMKQATHNNEASANSNTSAKAGASNDPITSAEAAAPASIAHQASIVTVDASGAMKTLRQGSNGWTCMPNNPAAPGHDPMCMDANAMKWAAAWIADVHARWRHRRQQHRSLCAQADRRQRLGQDRSAHHGRGVEGHPRWNACRAQARYCSALRDVGRHTLRAFDGPGGLTAQ